MPLSMPFLFGASVAGAGHLKLGIPCQDAFACETLGGGFAAFAIADGLGGEKESELGAFTAVSAAMEAVEKLLLGQNPAEAKIEEIVRACFPAARAALEQKALEKNLALHDLACTMLAGVMTGSAAAVAHVGDGAVVAQSDEGLKLISGPGESEYVNEVVPLTSKDYESQLRVSGPVPGVICLAAFTDGCQRAGLVKSAGKFAPHEKFFAPIFAWAVSEVSELDQASNEIKTLLASPKMGKASDDDKTLVVAVLKRRDGE